MNIGEFKLNKGRILGWIATRTIDLPKLALRPVESENELAPAYEIIAPNVGGRVVQVGALWEAVAKRTGEVFYQGNVDDPSMPEALPIALFGSIEEGFRVAWRRENPLLAGTSPAPKHGPQKPGFMMTPALSSLSLAPTRLTSRLTGTLIG